MTRVRRHLPRALWCAGLGLCATLAVSWACALWSEPDGPGCGYPIPIPSNYISLDVRESASFGRTCRQGVTTRGTVRVRLSNSGTDLVVTEDLVETAKASLLKQAENSTGQRPENPQFEIDSNAGGRETAWAFEEARSGWPMRTFIERSVNVAAYSPLTGVTPPAALGALTPPGAFMPWGAGDRQIPFHPIWPGLLVNTAFYASLIWFGVFRIEVARRAYRTQRGRCAECGYELAGFAKCPECGAETPRRDSTSSVSLSRSFAVSLGFSRVASLLPLRSSP